MHGDAPVAAVLALDRLLGLDGHSRPCREVRPNPCLLKSLDDEVSRNAVLGDAVALSVAAGDQPDHWLDVESEERDSVDDALRPQVPDRSTNAALHGTTGTPSEPLVIKEVR